VTALVEDMDGLLWAMDELSLLRMPNPHRSGAIVNLR